MTRSGSTEAAASAPPEPADAPAARPARRRPAPLTWIALLGAAVFVLVGIGTPLLGLSSFAAADLVQVRQPWKSTAPTGFVPQIPAVSDTVDSVLPARHYFREQLGHGEVATWDPLAAGGTGLGGSVTPALYTPLSLPYLLLPTWLAPAYAKLLELAAAIGFTMLFAARLRLSRAAGLVGGVVFAASGFMVVWTNWPQTQTAALIPALFWAVERFAQVRTARSAVPIAAVVAVLLLGGFPAVAGYACYAAGPYLLLRLGLATGWRPLPVLRGAVTSGVALALGAGLVAVVLLPLAAQLSGSDYLSERAQTPSVHLPPLMLLTLPAWRVYGSVVGDGYWGPFTQIEGLSYIGAAALALIVFGLVRRPGPDVAPGARGYFLVAAAVTVVLGYVGGPLLGLAQHLPVFADNPVFRIRSVLGFFLAVLAAFGYDALLRRGGGRSRARVAVEVAGWALAGLAGLLAARRLLAIARDVGRVPFVERQLLYAGLAAGAVFAAGILATVLRSRPRDRGPRTLALAVVPAVVVVESLYLVVPFWPRIPTDEFYPVTAAHRFLSANLGSDRYGARGLTLFSGTNVYYDQRSVTGHAFTEREWKELLLTADPGALVSPTFSTFSGSSGEATVRSPVLDLMAVRYFATAVEDPVYGRTTRVGTAGAGAVLRPGRPVEVPLGTGPVRAVGPVVTADARPADPAAALELDLLDARGRVLVHADRRLFAAVRPGPVTVPVPGEDVAGAVTARLTLRSDVPLAVLGGARPRLDVVRPVPGDGLRLVFADGAVVYRRTTAYERFRWADHVRVEPAETRRLTVLANVRDPGRVVLDAPAPAPADGKPATVAVRTDGADDLAAEVVADGSGYLVVADALRTGWTATVDGRPAPLVAADHALAAVPVPAGRHTVRLDYRVPGQRTGTAVSLASLAGLVLLGGTGAVLDRRRRRRRAPA